MTIKEAMAVYKEVMKAKKLPLVKKSDTLAIMGSGYSINELGLKDYEFLKAIDVLAINHFAFHEQIVPDFYMYEGITDVAFHHEAIRLINLRAEKYKNVIFFFKSYPWFKRHGSLAEEFNKFDKKLLSRIKLFKTDFSIKAIRADQVTPELFKIKNILGPHPQLKGSLTAALSWAYNMGYKDVILYGVDLEGPYFWEDPNVIKPKKHSSATVLNQELTAGELIPLIRDNIFKKSGKEISIASKTSKLYPNLPLWNNYEK